MVVVLGVLAGIVLWGGFLAAGASAVWLLVLGQWKPVLAGGFLCAFLGPRLIGFALMPSVPLFDLPALRLLERGSLVRAHLLGLLSALYLTLTFTAWCAVVLFTSLKMADAHSLLPMLGWSYACATGPIAYLAFKDQENPFSTMSLSCVQIAYIVAIVLQFCTGATPLQIVVCFAAILGIGELLIHVLGWSMEKEARSLDQELSRDSCVMLDSGSQEPEISPEPDASQVPHRQIGQRSPEVDAAMQEYHDRIASIQAKTTEQNQRNLEENEAFHHLSVRLAALQAKTSKPSEGK